MYKYNRDFFCRLMIINEALFGQSEQQLQMMIDEVDVNLDFEFTDFYLFLTGLPKKIYTSYLKMNRKDFMLILDAFISEVEVLKQHYGICLQHAVLNYDQSKQIIFLIKKGDFSERDIYRFCCYLTSRLQHFYATLRDLDSTHLANFSILSSYIKSYEQLAPTFAKVHLAAQLAYFDMKPVCVQCEQIQPVDLDISTIKVYVGDIIDSLMENDSFKMDTKLEQIFHLVKNSFSYYSLEALLNESNRMLQTIVDQFALQEAITLPLDVKRDPCIEVTLEKVRYTLHQLASCLVSDNDSKLSGITQNVLFWVKDNYHKDAGLQTVADKLQLNPSYISRTFSRDMHCSFSSYLTKYRLERAKVLLVETDEKILTIAEKVGFNNGDYFSVVFKKEMGMSPQQYRHYYQINN